MLLSRSVLIADHVVRQRQFGGDARRENRPGADDQRRRLQEQEIRHDQRLDVHCGKETRRKEFHVSGAKFRRIATGVNRHQVS